MAQAMAPICNAADCPTQGWLARDGLVQRCPKAATRVAHSGRVQRNVNLPDARTAASGALATATPIDLLIQHAPVGIALIDADGLFKSVNPAYCAIYGYGATELLGSSVTRLLPAAQHDALLARHRAFLQDNQPLDVEWEVLRRDGRMLTVLGQSVRVPGPDGRPNRLVCVVDISQRKQAECALQSSQQFLHSVLDGLTAHVCVLDAQGNIIAVNRAWRAFALANGAAGGAVLPSYNYLSVCDNAAAAPTPTDATGGDPATFAAQLREVLAGRSAGFQADYPCDTPAGQLWFLGRVSPIAGSQPLQAVVAHDNVTALKQAQDTLRQSQALMLDMAASIPGAVFRLRHARDGRWHFTYVSPGIDDLFALTPAQVCGDIRALGTRILPEDLPAHDAAIRNAVATGSAFEQEYRIRLPDGSLKWVHCKAVPKPGANPVDEWTGMLTDVSGRKQMESVIKASEERYRTLFETVAQGVVYQDAQGRITSANPAAQRILGLTLAQLQGHHAIDPSWQALHEDGQPMAADAHPATQALHTGMPVSNVVMGLNLPGRGRTWLLVNAMPLQRNGRVDEVYASFEDITERVLLSQELKLQASTDFLTGAANRRSLMQRLGLEFDRVQRLSGYGCAVLAVDLDLFKQVNDTWGHAAGDAVLQHAAALMRQVTRQHDLVARSGGEEFTLVLPDTGVDDAQALAERLRDWLQTQPVQHQGRPLMVTVSIGVGLIEPADANVDAVLARADNALYQAKSAGRNRVCLAPAAALRAD